MEPKALVRAWVEAFNAGDADALAEMYAEDAVNHQVAYGPIEGRDAIRRLFKTEFERAEMVCKIVNLFQDDDWVIMEWTDPIGLHGCGLFRIENGLIALQRGYFDRVSFYESQAVAFGEMPR